MPYNDANRWLFSHLYSGTATILNVLKIPISYLKLEGIHTWYQLPKLVSPLNKGLLEAFKEEYLVMSESIQHWWEEGVPFTQKYHKLHLI
jgi:hypothetical protein